MQDLKWYSLNNEGQMVGSDGVIYDPQKVSNILESFPYREITNKKNKASDETLYYYSNVEAGLVYFKKHNTQDSINYYSLPKKIGPYFLQVLDNQPDWIKNISPHDIISVRLREVEVSKAQTLFAKVGFTLLNLLGTITVGYLLYNKTSLPTPLKLLSTTAIFAGGVYLTSIVEIPPETNIEKILRSYEREFNTYTCPPIGG